MSQNRRKKIKRVLWMMNKQNQRFIPVVPPLIDMMDMTTSEKELDFLITMGTDTYTYQQALTRSGMKEDAFQPFFDDMTRKGLIHIEHDSEGSEMHRLNAIAVGWYEAMMHYMMGHPREKEFSLKWNEFFLFFKPFNIGPLRHAQDLFLKHFLKPAQDTGIMDPEIKGQNKRKTIPINTEAVTPDSTVYPLFHINTIIEEYGNEDAIFAFPCVCRHGNSMIDSKCGYTLPKESCLIFGNMGKNWTDWGYGRKVTKEEAIDIMKEVREHGAVHTVLHEKDDYRLPVAAICNCCWDCCSILKPYNMGATSLKYRAFYSARITSQDTCNGCGICKQFCPTTAIQMADTTPKIDLNKCIGCGQCAFQCRQNSIELYHNRRTVYLPILKQSEVRISF